MSIVKRNTANKNSNFKKTKTKQINVSIKLCFLWQEKTEVTKNQEANKLEIDRFVLMILEMISLK